MFYNNENCVECKGLYIYIYIDIIGIEVKIGKGVEVA